MTALSYLVLSPLKSDFLIPFLLIIVYILFVVFARGYLPTGEELVGAFATLYARYGYEIVFGAAVLESLVLVNFFTPGIVAMALGAIFARSGQLELTLVVALASAGAIIGYSVDFLLGYFGLGEILKRIGYGKFFTAAKKQLDQLGNRGLILGFIHPTSGSFLSLAAGFSGMRVVNFGGLALASVIFWTSLWGLLFYSTGEVLLLVLTRYSLLVVFLVMAFLILSKLWRKGKEEKTNN